MRIIISIFLLFLHTYSSRNLSAQDDKSISKDSLVQFYSTVTPLQFERLERPMEGDTAVAIKHFAYLVNNDVYQSLYLNPNRNTGRGDSGYDYSRTKNYEGLFNYNMYTVYKSRTDGVVRVNYWHTGSNKSSLTRSLNIFLD